MYNKLAVITIAIVYCNAVWLCHCTNNIPNASKPHDSGSCTSDNDIENCDVNIKQELCVKEVKERKQWKPFKISTKEKWISMER